MKKQDIILKIKVLKKISIIFLIIVIIFLICYTLIIEIKIIKKNRKSSILNTNNQTNNIQDKKINSNIIFFKKYIITERINIENIFSDRAVTFTNNTLLLGNNKKQLENNYYDVKFIVNQDTNFDNYNISIYINKLYITNNKNLIEKNYLKNIIDLINNAFDLKLNKEDLEKMYIKISNNYSYMRTSYVENVDKLDKIDLNGYNFDISIKKSNLVLNIQDKR